MNRRIVFTTVLCLFINALSIAQNNVQTIDTSIVSKKEKAIQIKQMNFNSNSSDINPRFLENGLVFSSNRSRRKKTKSNYDFYIISDLSNPQLEKLTGKMRTSNNESSLYASKKNNTIYFSRNKKENEYVKSKPGDKIRLKSFTTQKEEGKWKKPKELPFNSDEYSVAHITLNASENKIYFVSDMKQGYGGTDLYEVNINENGTYGNPKNLGPNINTAANETTPFLIGDDTLYFASDKPSGFGGLDIFKTNLTNGEPINLGEPINSTADDHGLILNDKYVFFSSDRNEESTNDNIYSITPQDLKEQEENITRQNNVNLVANDSVAPSGNQKMSTSFDNLKPNNSKHLESSNTSTKSDFKLDKDYAGLERNLLFGFDNAGLRSEYQEHLDRLAVFLKKHENAKVTLAGHADQIGDANYNLNLSKKRALKLKKYLVANGVNENRITTVAEGEAKSLEECTNCSKAQNQQNRRVEIRLDTN